MLYFSTSHLKGGWDFFWGGALILVGPVKIAPFKWLSVCNLHYKCSDAWTTGINNQLHMWFLCFFLISFTAQCWSLWNSLEEAFCSQSNKKIHLSLLLGFIFSYSSCAPWWVRLPRRELSIQNQPSLHPSLWTLSCLFFALSVKCGLPCWSSTVVFCGWSSF